MLAEHGPVERPQQVTTAVAEEHDGNVFAALLLSVHSATILAFVVAALLQPALNGVHLTLTVLVAAWVWLWVVAPALATRRAER